MEVSISTGTRGSWEVTCEVHFLDVIFAELGTSRSSGDNRLSELKYSTTCHKTTSGLRNIGQDVLNVSMTERLIYERRFIRAMTNGGSDNMTNR